MATGPGFDPYDVLGVGPDADEVVIQLAYRARIREAHPDRAGSDGLAVAKRLNVARDWLLDPVLRAQLPRTWPGSSASTTGTARADRRSRWDWRPRRRHAAHRIETSDIDAFTYDFGPRTGELRTFFEAVASVSVDERARVNYSLGDGRPVHFDGYRGYLEPTLWGRSRALRAVVSRLWDGGVDERAPSVHPLGTIVPGGLLVANAYAQWILLGEFFRRELAGAVLRSEHIVDAFAARCIGPWDASVGQPRYGPYDPQLRAFFRTASELPADAAERLARSWLRHLGRDGRGDPSDHLGPGVWLPAPMDYPDVLKVSGYLAAVDASRIEPPATLAGRDRDAFRYGLRLTAHVLALGLARGTAGDYLQPWRDALEPDPSLWSRVRWRMSPG